LAIQNPLEALASQACAESSSFAKKHHWEIAPVMGLSAQTGGGRLVVARL